MMPASSAVKKIRICVGLEQEEFAKLVGVSKAAISNYERGLRTPRFPIIKKMRELAKDAGLDVPVEEFLN